MKLILLYYLPDQAFLFSYQEINDENGLKGRCFLWSLTVFTCKLIRHNAKVKIFNKQNTYINNKSKQAGDNSSLSSW